MSCSNSAQNPAPGKAGEALLAAAPLLEAAAAQPGGAARSSRLELVRLSRDSYDI